MRDILLASAFLLFASIGDASGQPEPPEIRFETITELSPGIEGGGFRVGTLVARDQMGGYYAAPLIEEGRIARFDAEGRFQSLLGARGSGPGEFQSVSFHALGPDDTIHVLDRRANRWSRLGSDGSFLSSAQLPAGMFQQAVLTHSGRLVLHLFARDPEGTYRPFHLLSADGTIERSFGPAMTDYEPRRSEGFLISLGSSLQAGFWGVRLSRYEVQRWTTDGRMAESHRIPSDWFEDWERPDPGEPYRSRPHPRVAGIAEDESGRLWLATVLASDEWNPADPEQLGQAGWVEWMKVAMKWRVEVFDPQSGAVLGRADFRNMIQVLPGGLIARAVTSEEGEITLRILKPILPEGL